MILSGQRKNKKVTLCGLHRVAFLCLAEYDIFEKTLSIFLTQNAFY